VRKITVITLILIIPILIVGLFWSLVAEPKTPAVLNSLDANGANVTNDSCVINDSLPLPENDSNGEAVTVLVVYHTTQYHTATLAKAVAEGVAEVPGARVVLKSVEQATSDDALNAQAIILGSPVHNASVTPAMQTYINSWAFGNPSFSDKIGAAFVTGGGISAGEELVQINLLASMLIYNMIVVGGPSWEQPFGASAITKEYPFQDKSTQVGYVDPQFLRKGKLLGKRVAQFSVRLQRGQNKPRAFIK